MFTIEKNFLDKSKLTYMDYNSSTPVYKEVLEAMDPFYNNWFYNPSAKYAKGIKDLFLNCKNSILNNLKAPSNSKIVFYGGGTEAVSSFLQGIAFYALQNNIDKKHIISSTIEHDASLETLKHLENMGFKVTLVPVDKNCVVNPKDIEKAITKDTLLVSIMHVNNETGVLQPIKEIAKITKKYNIPLHCDGIAAVGKIDINIEDLEVDAYTITAHKFYGPKGVAINYISNNLTTILPTIFGSKQEYGLRGGTENLTGAIGLTKALDMTISNQHNYIEKEKKLRDLFEEIIVANIENIIINGKSAERVCNTSSVSIKNTTSANLVQGLFEEGICTASGAASIGDNYSHVIKALNIDPSFASGTVRFSIGKYSTEEDIKLSARALQKVVERIRAVDNNG